MWTWGQYRQRRQVGGAEKSPRGAGPDHHRRVGHSQQAGRRPVVGTSAQGAADGLWNTCPVSFSRPRPARPRQSAADEACGIRLTPGTKQSCRLTAPLKPLATPSHSLQSVSVAQPKSIGSSPGRSVESFRLKCHIAVTHNRLSRRSPLASGRRNGDQRTSAAQENFIDTTTRRRTAELTESERDGVRRVVR